MGGSSIINFKNKQALIFFLIVSVSGYKYILSTLVSNKFNVDQFISQVMAYPMTNVIDRCQKDFGYSDQDMIVLEKELKRFLILAAINDRSVGMYSKYVDDLWHTFILFTKEYAAFCNKFAGRFIHHLPITDQEKKLEDKIKVYQEFDFFIEKYENTFNEKAHDIWYLDACSKQEFNFN